MNLYTGKADWTWVWASLGWKMEENRTEARWRNPIRGTPLQASETDARMCVHTHTPLHTYMLVTPGRSLFMAVAFAKTEVQFNCAYAHFKGETLASARVGGWPKMTCQIAHFWLQGANFSPQIRGKNEDHEVYLSCGARSLTHSSIPCLI